MSGKFAKLVFGCRGCVSSSAKDNDGGLWVWHFKGGRGGGKQFSHHSSSFKHTLLMIMIEGLRRSDAVPLFQMPRKSAPEWNQQTQNNWCLLVLLLMMTTMMATATTMMTMTMTMMTTMMELRMLRMRNEYRGRGSESATMSSLVKRLWDPFGHFKHILFVCICIRTHSLTWALKCAHDNVLLLQ